MSDHQFLVSVREKLIPFRNLITVLFLSSFLLILSDELQAKDKKENLENYQNRVYVPFSELDSIFGSDRKGILLPVKQFEELQKKTRENKKSVPVSAGKLNITGIQYEAEIQNESILISTEIQLQQYQSGWQSVLLPVRDLFVQDALQNENPALLGRTEKGLHLFHQTTGSFTVKLKLVAPLSSLGSDQLASFHLIPSSNASFTIRIPEKKFLYIDGLKSSTPEIKEKQKIFNIEVGGQNQLELRITDKKADQISDALLFATTGIDVALNPGELNWKANTTAQVFGQKIDQLNFTIPVSLQITEVKSHGLESWNLEEIDDDRLQIKLKYRQSFTGTREIQLKGIQSLISDEEWMIPNLGLIDVTNHVGRLNISHPVSYRFQKIEGDGILLNQKNYQTNKSVVQNKRKVHSYSIWNEEFEFLYTMIKKSNLPQLQIHQILEIREKGLDVTYLGKIYPVSSALHELDVEVPLEWEITSAALDDEKLDWQVISTEAGSQKIRLTFGQPIPMLKEKTLYLSAHHNPEDWPLEEKAAEIVLPEISISGMDQLSGSYVINSEVDMIVVPIEIKGMTPAVLNVKGAKLGYLFKQESISGRIKVTRKPARISSENLSVTRLDRDSLRSHLEAKLQIEGGGIRQLDVAVSQNAGTDIRFLLQNTTAKIVEQKELKTVDSSRIWRIRFDRRLKGNYVLYLDVETDKDGMTDFSPHEISIENIERQHGYVVIEARQEQRLSIQAVNKKQKPLDEVDPGNLPLSVQKERERIVASYHYIEQGYQIVFNEEQLDRVSVPTAICHQSQYKTVLNPGGKSQHYANYQFVAIGVQSLLIKLPGEAELWATLIDDKPIEVRKTDHGYEVALTAVTPSEKNRKLELFYSTDEKEIQAFGTLGQSPPLLSVIDGSGKIQAIDVLKQHWSVHHPRTTMLVASTGHFVSQTEMDRSGIMSWIQDQFHSLHQWSLMNKVITLVLVLAVIGLFAKLFAKMMKNMTASKILYLLCGFSLVCVMGLLLLPSVQQSREAAQRTEARNQEMIDELETDRAAEESEKDGLTDGISIDIKNSVKAITKRIHPNLSKEIIKTEKESKAKKGLKKKRPQKAQVAIGRQKSGARLSVAIQFQAPENWSQKEFQYLGTSSGSQEELLQVQYEDKTQSFLYRNIAIVLVILLCWFMRNRSRNVQLICLLSSFILPLILMQVVPYYWYSILDGLFLGSFYGGFLLMVVCCCCYTGKVFQSFQNAGTITQVLIISLAFFATDSVVAKDKKVVQKRQQIKTIQKNIPVQIPIVKPVLKTQEKVVVVPYEAGEDPLKSDQVFLPYDEYLQLWNQAYPENPLETEPPVKALVAGAIYHGVISSEAVSKKSSISVKGRIVFHNLTDSQVSIALPFKPPAIRNTKLDGKVVSLQVIKTSKGIEHQVILSETGLHILDIEFDIPAEISEQVGQFSVKINSVPSGQFTLALPGPDLNVTVKGIQSSLINHQSGDKPMVSFPIDRGGEFQVFWQPKQTGSSGDSTIHVTSSSILNLDDAGVHLTSSHSLKVRQGSLNQMDYQIPAEMMIQDVTGRDIGGWKISGEDDNRKLVVYFRREVDDLTTFQVKFYQNLQVSEEEFSVSRFGPMNVTHETGEIGIYSHPGLSIKMLEVEDLKKIDRGNFKPLSKIESSAKLESVYRYAGAEISLSSQVSRKMTRMKTTVFHGLEVKEDSIQYAHHYQFEIMDSPLSQLSLSVPPGYQVKSVKSNVLEEWYLNEDEFGDNVLLLTFISPQEGKVTLNITAEVPLELNEETTDLILPFTMIESKMDSKLGIWIDDSLNAILEGKEGWRQVDPHKMPADLRNLKTQQINYSFQSSEEEISPVSFQLSRVKPQIQGSSASIVTLTNVLMNYQYALKWKIKSGSANHFSFIIPSEFQKYVEIQGGNIRQIKSSKFTPKLTRWEIFTQEPVKNEYFLVANILMPPPPKGRLKITSPILQQLKKEGSVEFEDVNLQQHYFVLVNQSNGQLILNGKKNSSEISPESIPIEIEKELTRQALAVEQFNKPGVQTQYAIEENKKEEGLPASVNQARLTSILDMDGSWRMQAVYRMKNLKRQFLAVHIPENSRLLSAFVASQPIRPSMTTINNKKVHLIPLPKTSEVDLALDVTLTLAGELENNMLPKGFNVVSHELEFPAPAVISQKEDSNYGIPVARTDWTLFLPDSLEIVSSENNSGMNLQGSNQELAMYYRERAMLNEVKELFTILENEETSDTLRFRCWSNLKQLEGEIRQQGKDRSHRNRSISGGFSTPSKVITENEDLRNDVLSDFKSNRARIKKNDVSNNSISFKDESLQRVSGLGVKQQIDFFQTQSSNIIRSNGFGGIYLENDEVSQLKNNKGVKPKTQTVKTSKEFGFQLNQPVDIKVKELAPSVPVQQRREISKVEQRNRAIELNEELVKRNSFSKKDKPKRDQHRKGKTIMQRGKSSFGSSFSRKSGGAGGNTSGGQKYFSGNGGVDFVIEQFKNSNIIGGKNIDSDKNGIVSGTIIDGNGILNDKISIDTTGSSAPSSEITKNVIGNESVSNQGWTSAGGISLAIRLPEEGTPYSFQKVNGAPKLVLQVRSRKTREFGIGMFWFIAWTVIALISFLTLIRKNRIRKVIPVLVTLAGITLFVSFGNSLSMAGLIIFVIGVIILAFQYFRQNQSWDAV